MTSYDCNIELKPNQNPFSQTFLANNLTPNTVTFLPVPSSSGPSSSSSPSLLTKSLSLEPSCSPCGHLGALDADSSQQPSSDPGPSSSTSGPASLEGGAELAERRGSANGLLLVNDTGPPELPATTITPPSKSRPPLPGPKPQGKNLIHFFFLSHP